MTLQTKTSKKRTVLVTGASGFIGSQLVDYLLAEGHFVKALVRSAEKTVPVRPSLEIIEGAVEGPALTPTILRRTDAVIHCAARVHRMRETSSDPMAEYRKENVDNTLSLADRCLSAGVKLFVFFSTVKVMGVFERTDRVLTENDQPCPADHYGVSKYEAEEALKSLFKGRLKSRCIILRLPMVYGPGNKGNMLSLLSAARRRLRLPLKGATGKRSIIYVGNVCNAVGAIMDRHADHAEMAAVFNLTDETDRTSAELYAAIYQGINGAPGIFYFPPGFIRLIAGLNGRSKAIVARLFDDYRFSSSKFQTEYQWRPVFSFLEGITATVTWYQTARIS